MPGVPEPAVALGVGVLPVDVGIGVVPVVGEGVGVGVIPVAVGPSAVGLGVGVKVGVAVAPVTATDPDCVVCAIGAPSISARFEPVGALGTARKVSGDVPLAFPLKLIDINVPLPVMALRLICCTAKSIAPVLLSTRLIGT